MAEFNQQSGIQETFSGARRIAIKTKFVNSASTAYSWTYSGPSQIYLMELSVGKVIDQVMQPVTFKMMKVKHN